MPLRVAEINGWLKAVNKCRECPFMTRYPEKGMVCEHLDIRMTEHEFKSLSAEDVIPIWCPLPTGEYKLFKVLEPENNLDIHTDHIRKKLPNP